MPYLAVIPLGMKPWFDMGGAAWMTAYESAKIALTTVREVVVKHVFQGFHRLWITFRGGLP